MLFLIQDSDRPMYVYAKSWQDAIDLWMRKIEAENELAFGECDEPKGVSLIADDDDIILPGEL